MAPAELQFEVLTSRISQWLGSSCQVIGVGIDLVDVLAMTHLIESGGQMFIDDAWTPLEQQQTLGDCRRLAGRWAIKEAVMKALGHGLGEISPLDIQTQSAKSGALELELDRSAALAADSMGVSAWHISVAYDSSWAIGAAVAVRSGRKRRRKNER
jgi:holo-[acyl-carrier protein] synthase